MRRFWAVLVAGVLVAGCGAGGEGGARTGEAAAGRDAPSELRLAVGGESDDGYDPTLGWGSYGAPLFHSTLLRRDADLELVPDLATGYELSGDGQTWTVELRDDAVFSDGEPVTASDVAFTFTAAASTGAILGLEVLDDAVAVDDTTVELRLSQPQSTFVNRLATLGIVPEHAHGDDYGRNPIGSGPYVLERWDEGQQLIAVANPDYYGGAPAFERLVFLFTDEDATMAAARAGEVHLAAVPQTTANEPVEGMQLVAVKSVDNRGIVFPYQPAGETTDDGTPIGDDVTSDLAIRQAVNIAIDRAALVDGILDGHGSAAHGPVDGLPWFEPSSAVEDADTARADQLLTDAGWVDGDGDGVREREGTPAAFEIVYPSSDSVRQGLAVAVADMLRPIGLDVTPRGASWDEIPSLMHSTPVLFGWGSHDQTEMYNLYHSSRADEPDYYNAGLFRDDHVDVELDAAMAARSEEEATPHWQAAQLDGEGNGFTTAGEAAWAWLVNLDHTYLADACLDLGPLQVEPHGHGWPITAGITGWQWTC